STSNHNDFFSFFIVKHDFNTYAPLSISGPTFLCQASTITLNSSAETGVTQYDWYLPDGATVTSGGTSTTSPTIDINIPADPGIKNFVVSFLDGCIRRFSP